MSQMRFGGLEFLGISTFEISPETDKRFSDIQNLSLLKPPILLLSVLNYISKLNAIISGIKIDLDTFHAHIILFVDFYELYWGQVLMAYRLGKFSQSRRKLD